MYHSVSYGMEGQIKDHDDMRNEVGILQEMYDSLFSSTKLSEVKWMKFKKVKRDYFFSANEAVELGIADQVLGEPQEESQVNPIHFGILVTNNKVGDYSSTFILEKTTKNGEC
ncbi:ATP-dependent Clp protease proteolytic subunit [Bacillus licheniformis]|uniref:ATP-dependent Clp protease proteolytic subunit n=1 Tax=Bacillus licheniformis TaxID=1402 RepID=UPI003BF749D0